MASNRNALKKYAPQARLDFIQAMTNRAAQFGITKASITQGAVQGDLYILNGKAFPRSVASQRDRLASRIARDGFDQAMEAIAYTWFNRFLAIRYMEIHDYFDHGFRVLSHPGSNGEPQILEQVAKVDLPGLNRDEIVSLKLDGSKDEQIYRKILIAQCNDLHRAMPFLFERIDDETELLLPENLLQSDSIIRKLVDEIDEVEWQEIEIIGWLYQYYISDKKDEVIGKVVKSEDIPAATQLFTPNWIVKYMVQNSLGAQWMATYPNSALAREMEYYIAPTEQTPEVQAQLDAITSKELDSEAITLIDPAVGSGHILVEAYNLFRTIYLERGYTRKEAARSILSKNLFGLDIDTRAAQMAGFALLMKARADDRSLLRDPPRINVLAIRDSREMDADALASTLVPDERFELVPSNDLLPETLPQPTLTARRSNSKEGAAIRALIALFDGADTFGSLITVPQSVLGSLDMIEALVAKPLSTDLLSRQAQVDARDQIMPLIHQARLLGATYDCVVANPPYIGVKGMNPKLKKYLQDNYGDVKSDVFAAFIVRGTLFAKPNGKLGFMSPFVWMFISSYEKLRSYVLDKKTITSLVQLEYSGFDGATVPICTFTLSNTHSADFKGGYVRLSDFRGSENQAPKTLEAISDPNCGWFFTASASDFAKLPGSPIAYWLSEKLRSAFSNFQPLSTFATARQGLSTTDNNRFVRYWHEININDFGHGFSNTSDADTSGFKWFPFNKGGAYRRWAGNNELVVNWANDGSEIKSTIISKYPYLNGNPDFVAKNTSFYFKPGLTWSALSSGTFSLRDHPIGFIFSDKGQAMFPFDPSHKFSLCGLLNSNVAVQVLKALSPTLDFNSGYIANIPCAIVEASWVPELISISQNDWDSYETSWNFQTHSLFRSDNRASSIQAAYRAARIFFDKQTLKMASLEKENNIEFSAVYGLQEAVHSNISMESVSLTCNPHYRYGGNLSDAEREDRLRSDTMRELISYAVGCVMGRYSLAEPGLIYAHSGGIDFNLNRYGRFPADEDGIIPITEDPWFEDDVTNRIEEFLGVAWPAAPVMETLSTLTDGLTIGKGGEPRDALRGYLSKQFFKDHLQTYKNRPIYWLFSSGKQKAFEALVYLHRYNEGTLARMRTNYVTPLMGKLQQRISDLEADVASSASSAEKARKTKEKDKFGKQLVELRRFDEELRHLADQRIAIDLDDGVKVNYAKFGNLLSGVDKICGKDKDD
jgi:type II restriction/modification system DNA methylase subunit YeeA